MEGQELDIVEGQVVAHRPTLDDERVAEVIRHFKLFEELKTSLLDHERDAVYYNKKGWVVPAGDPNAVSSYICKSGWLKLSVAFGVHFEAVPYADGTWGRREEREDANGAYYLWQYHVKASMPDGRSVPAVGVCTSRDPFFTKGGKVVADEANVMLKAQTVAFNRAIAFLIAGGELSAEEIAGRLEPRRDEGVITMPFGKHEGETVADIFMEDPGYVAWLASDKFEPRTDGAREIKAEAARFLAKGDEEMASLMPSMPDEPVPDESIIQSNASWADVPKAMKLAVAGEIMQRSTGQIIVGYEPSEHIAPLWREDVAKLNGHASKWYLGDDPTRVDGKPGDYIRRMKWGTILELLNELRSRHWLLKELRARAELLEHVDKETALAELISSRYAEAHGMARGWRKWAKAIVRDMTPDEIKDIRGFLDETENPFPGDGDDLDAALAEMVA